MSDSQAKDIRIADQADKIMDLCSEIDELESVNAALLKERDELRSQLARFQAMAIQGRPFEQWVSVTADRDRLQQQYNKLDFAYDERARAFSDCVISKTELLNRIGQLEAARDESHLNEHNTAVMAREIREHCVGLHQELETAKSLLWKERERYLDANAKLQNQAIELGEQLGLNKQLHEELAELRERLAPPQTTTIKETK